MNDERWKDAVGEAVEEERQKDAGEDGAGQAGGQGMKAGDAVDSGYEGGVEEGPMRGGGAGRREGVPGLGEAVAVARGETQRELGVGGFVLGWRRGVAQVQRHGDAQQDGEHNDSQQDEAVLFGGHGRRRGAATDCTDDTD